MADQKSAEIRTALRNIRSGVARATQKFTISGNKNPNFKPVTLRRADYERQKDSGN